MQGKRFSQTGESPCRHGPAHGVLPLAGCGNPPMAGAFYALIHAVHRVSARLILELRGAAIASSMT